MISGPPSSLSIRLSEAPVDRASVAKVSRMDGDIRNSRLCALTAGVKLNLQWSGRMA